MTVKIGFPVTEDLATWDAILSNADQVGNNAVVSGIFKGDISEYAHHNEFGAPRANIPKRPFMRNSFDQNRQKYEKMFADFYTLWSGGTRVNVLTSLVRIGVESRNDMIKTISRGGFRANAPSTVLAKRSSKPLVDTGDMQRASTFFVGSVAKVMNK